MKCANCGASVLIKAFGIEDSDAELLFATDDIIAIFNNRAQLFNR